MSQYGTAYCLKCQKHFCFCPESINYHILSEEEEEEDNSLVCSESIESTPSPAAPASTAPGPSTTTTKNIQQKQSCPCNKREKVPALPNQPTKNITIQMPRRCCVPGCKGNYDTTLKAEDPVSTFSFPKEQELLEKWIRAIPRKDWIPTKSSAVCANHFCDSDIVRFSEFTLPNGQINKIPLKYPKLNQNAVPII
ncbi:unnamed protein product [Acanthoscelides obtectus]|uniref:THAP-type domain-containing protein n=1 Tax=Acanthoscelides obtectus TaxID=200917 RepID=A0A9P0LF86_ACAOB|nr:unnamed protein product [Acanthoscelides obtectus]CAK1681253.1 THAP domain-containing protein 5 [Acanthoscelides obtectus]